MSRGTFVHLTLLLSVQQIVYVLHAHELRPAVFLGHELHHCELVCPHAAGTYISDLPLFDEVVQGFHRFLDWDGFIEAVDLEEVDVVGPQSF